MQKSSSRCRVCRKNILDWGVRRKEKKNDDADLFRRETNSKRTHRAKKTAETSSLNFVLDYDRRFVIFLQNSTKNSRFGCRHENEKHRQKPVSGSLNRFDNEQQEQARKAIFEGFSFNKSDNGLWKRYVVHRSSGFHCTVDIVASRAGSYISFSGSDATLIFTSIQ